MKFSVDDAFAIGGMHLREGKPCQDYTASGFGSANDEVAWAAVSDGCSSGRHTDVGARLWTRCTGPLVGVFWPNIGELEAAMWVNVTDTMYTMNLERDDMLATNLYVVAAAAHGATIRVRGDGAVAVQYKNDDWIYHHFAWANNAPAYPIYAEDKFAGYTAMQGGAAAEAFTVHTKARITLGSSEPQDFEQVENLSVEEGIAGWTSNIGPEVLRGVSKIAVFTDGVDQVEGYTWDEVMHALLAFKTPNGGFAKRRFHRFQRDVLARGRGPQDDIGYAVIQVGD